MELCAQVSEKDWLYWDFEMPSENTLFNVYLGPAIF